MLCLDVVVLHRFTVGLNNVHIGGLMQGRRNFSAKALE